MNNNHIKHKHGKGSKLDTFWVLTTVFEGSLLEENSWKKRFIASEFFERSILRPFWKLPLEFETLGELLS